MKTYIKEFDYKGQAINYYNKVSKIMTETKKYKTIALGFDVITGKWKITYIFK